MLEKYSEHLRRALRYASRLGPASVSPAHLLLAILRENDCRAVAILRTLGHDPAVLTDRLARRLSLPETAPSSSPEAAVAPATARLLALSGDFRRWLGHGRTGTEHFLLALVSGGVDRPLELLEELGLDGDRTYETVLVNLADPIPEPAQGGRQKPLGQALKEMELLDNTQLNEAMAIQRKEGGVLGDILVKLGYVSREEILLALAAQMGMEVVELQDILGRPEAEVVFETEEGDRTGRAGWTPDPAPVVRLLDLILATAIQAGCTDLHFELFEESFQVRFRVEGILYEMESPPLHLAGAILMRLKRSLGLDPFQKKLPQESSGWVTLSGGRHRVEVSTLPTLNGESLVVRILPGKATGS